VEHRQLTWDELSGSEKELINNIVDLSTYGLQVVDDKLQLVLTKPKKKSRIKK
jgi:hypothetical protein